MQLKIINSQRKVKLDKKIIEDVVQVILEEEKVQTDSICLHFVNGKKIKELHKQYFNDPTITDCISLPIDRKDEKAKFHILGEAFICTDVAIENAKIYKTSVFSEIILYVIHTILHLIGYDDISKKDRAIMRKKEKYYLEKIKSKKIFK